MIILEQNNTMDPMLEEVGQAFGARCRPPKGTQCSVEPTTDQTGVEVPAMHKEIMAQQQKYLQDLLQLPAEVCNGEVPRGGEAKEVTEEFATDTRLHKRGTERVVQSVQVVQNLDAGLQIVQDERNISDNEVLKEAEVLKENVTEFFSGLVQEQRKDDNRRLEMGENGQEPTKESDKISSYNKQQGDQENVAESGDGQGKRPILAEAEGRLNKEGKAQQGQKNVGRGVSRFVVPLKKALLCPPPPKTKVNNKKTETENSSHMGKKMAKLNKKAPQTVEEKAATLLLRSSGVLGAEEPLNEDVQQHFGEKFFEPLQAAVLGDIRDAFGLPREGGAGALEVLSADAEE